MRVHDSQAYRKMDVTRERIRRILELREMLLSVQIGFSLVNAAVACAILESNHRSHDNLQQDLADRRIANPMDPVLSHHTSQERQPAAVPELPKNKPHQSPKQSHAEDHTEQIEATSGDDHR